MSSLYFCAGRVNILTKGNSGVKGKKGIRLGAILLAAGLLTGCKADTTNLNAASEMIQNLDYQGALEVLNQAEDAGENSRLIDRARGIAYMGLTEYEQAVEAFLASLAGSNGLIQDVDFDLNFYLAAAYTKAKRYEEAAATYDAILALRPDEKDAYFLRGNVRMHLNDFDGAKEDFDKTVLLDPKNYDRIIEIFEVLDAFGYKTAGQEYLQAALDSKDRQMSNYCIGRIYYYLGEYQKAYLALEDAREKGGTDSYLYLGRSYEATGDYNYAISVYMAYLGKYGGNDTIYNQLGLCRMVKGEYQEALEAFEEGLKQDNVTIAQTLSFNKIVAYEHLGEYKKAFALLEEYLKKYPDDESAKREYDFLKTR